MAVATPANSNLVSGTKVDVAIIGAGPIGLECAILAKRAGLSHIVLDKGPITAAIARYPTYMTFFTTSERLEVGGHPLVTATDKPTRKEALDYYRKVVANDELNVRTYSRVLAIKRVAANKEGFEVAVEAAGASGFSGTVSAGAVMVATGYFDNPNPLGVPGEEQEHVSHYYTEAHPFFGRPVTLVGGGSSAAHERHRPPEERVSLGVVVADVLLLLAGHAERVGVVEVAGGDHDRPGRDRAAEPRGAGGFDGDLEPLFVGGDALDGQHATVRADVELVVGHDLAVVVERLLARRLVGSGYQWMAANFKPLGGSEEGHVSRVARDGGGDPVSYT